MTAEEKKTYNKAKNKAYRTANPEKIKAYYLANREHAKNYYIAHREDYLAKAKARRLLHREEINARERVYRAIHRNKVNSYRLVGRHRISEKELKIMLNNQDGVCAICEKDDWNGKRPAIDHDHLTGKVRGILCGNCNMALGHIKDDPKIAQAMKDYLEYHNNLYK